MATGLENLKIYRMAADAEVEVHEITKLFPPDEKYRSVDQLRRSLSSTTNNIAEAYNKRSIKDKIRVLNDIAKCEAEETKRNLVQSARKKLADEKKLLALADKYTEILMGISGYIRFLNKQKLTNL